MSLGFFLVDDHAVVRRGLIELLCADPELDCVGEAASVAEAMTKIPAAGPDVAVVDDWLPDGHGVELCRDLLSLMPDLRCLMMTSHTSDEAMLYAILAGGSGYVVKNIKGMELACAIKDVGAGRSLLEPRATAALLKRLWRIAEKDDGLWDLNDRDRATELPRRGPDQQADRRADQLDRRYRAQARVAPAGQTGCDALSVFA